MSEAGIRGRARPAPIACWPANTVRRTSPTLIGQEPMVRTLTNAFSSRPHRPGLDADRRARRRQDDHRPHPRPRAELQDGRRSTSRRSTLRVPGEHCQAIMEGRHVDVVEMDAASHTGIDDIREIIEQVRYAPVSARYKVYIIDEVHMLSTQAFNGLLKTLEEPPPHVKFIFATTEIRKVPITVLSRCQRFDLRRVDAETLVGASRQDRRTGRRSRSRTTALAMIARAAEGSVRDALSILDQAIAHGAGHGDGRDRARHARPRRPRPRHRPVRACDEGRHGGRARRIPGAVRHRRRSGDGADRPCRIHAFRHAAALSCRRRRATPR